MMRAGAAWSLRPHLHTSVSQWAKWWEMLRGSWPSRGHWPGNLASLPLTRLVPLPRSKGVSLIQVPPFVACADNNSQTENCKIAYSIISFCAATFWADSFSWFATAERYSSSVPSMPYWYMNVPARKANFFLIVDTLAPFP